MKPKNISGWNLLIPQPCSYMNDVSTQHLPSTKPPTVYFPTSYNLVIPCFYIIGRFRSRRQKWSQNGMAHPYMGIALHFHVVFNIHVLNLNLSNLHHITSAFHKPPTVYFPNIYISLHASGIVILQSCYPLLLPCMSTV